MPVDLACAGRLGTSSQPPEVHGVALIKPRRPLRTDDKGVANDTDIEQFVSAQTKLAGHFGRNGHLRFFTQAGGRHGNPSKSWKISVK
ncbi:protein of unknown function [Sterolibacterium denitrificans]|uniref:Uncharacterized protein n=1 Tax=Sterolibacterium denitrificans TaxID=157592 RepID=A0A7Z7HQV2_9PROT|nr:protein of unknown function [Sterolibacterium denitrificans]